MASIHRQPGNPNWFAAYRIYDAQTNQWRRVFRSTRTRDKRQAFEIMRAWHNAALKASDGKLSIDAAREIIAQGVRDVYLHARAESLPSASIKSWCESWLKSKEIEVGSSTHTSYKAVVERFIDFLGDAPS